MELAANERAEPSLRASMFGLLASVAEPAAVPVLIATLEKAQPDLVQPAALAALLNHLAAAALGAIHADVLQDRAGVLAFRIVAAGDEPAETPLLEDQRVAAAL